MAASSGGVGYSARDAVRAYVDYLEMSRKGPVWKAETLGDQPWLALRLRRLEALFSAFGLGHPSELYGQRAPLEGTWSMTHLQWTPALAGRLRELARRHSIQGYEHSRLLADPTEASSAGLRDKCMELHFLFRATLTARRSVIPAERLGEGFMEGTGLIMLGFHLDCAWRAWQRPLVREMEELLALMLDPDGRTVSREALVERQGFPEEGLKREDEEAEISGAVTAFLDPVAGQERGAWEP